MNLAINGGGLIMQNYIRQIPCNVFIMVFMLLALALFSYAGNSFAAGKKYDGVKNVNPETGRAEIAGETEPYLFLKARITSTNNTTIVFKQKTCATIGSDGKEYSDCWIRISGWSKGLSMSQNAPLSMKTLSVKISGDQATHNWNTSRVSGPDGSIEIVLPANGFVDLHFLWELPDGVDAKVIRIKDLIEIKL
ncbi:hypothetical protein [uncultured Desulfosarcina sp.]|uniref:hypothetical protein n=1 Tax=uncultured Desulfosarcina sp. TaxID=218289 RepID=UPI0029C8FD81|nr:hypothetical protein [uncultured Desulfosarcina sp.]